METKYYSIKDIANKYSLAVSTIKKWIYQDKTLNAIKVGGAVRVSEEDLKKIITKIN